MQKEYIKEKVSNLMPYEKNARINDNAVDKVAESIKQCEYISPICIDENNVILCGHTRVKALQKLGYKDCEVIKVTGLTEEQKKKFRLLDNKTTEFAEWDFGLLSEELENLDFGSLEIDWGIDNIDNHFQFDDEDNNANTTHKELLKCPCCGHINEAKAFKNYEDTD